MKKYSIILILLVFILSGCEAEVGFNNLNQDYITNIAMNTQIVSTNSSKNYYSYYLPTDVGRIKSTELSELLNKNNTKVIMNFETSNLIIEQFYTEETKDSKSIKELDKKNINENELVFNGTYENNNKEELTYKLIVKKVEDNKFFIFFDGYVVNFYLMATQDQLEPQLINIFKIAKSLKYDRELILNSFSLKSASSSKAESFDFTKDNMPENGMLSEMTKENTVKAK